MLLASCNSVAIFMLDTFFGFTSAPTLSLLHSTFVRSTAFSPKLLQRGTPSEGDTSLITRQVEC